MAGTQTNEGAPQLQQIREELLAMGRSVETMIAGSVQALIERDDDLARHVMQQDQNVDRLERDNDDLCLKYLTRWHPIGADLRFVATALKIVTDLERIGDMAVNIAERAQSLNAEPPLKPYVDLPRMAEAARWMVHQALEAFMAGDVDAAREVIEQDASIDACCIEQIFRELITFMMENPRNIPRAISLQWMAKHIERIGDHATNIAEMVVFMVQGQDIRHTARAPLDS